MSEPVKVGDLTIVVHECCAGIRAKGKIRVIGRIEYGTSVCGHCGQYDTALHASSVDCPNSIGLPVSWLRKIDPPAEGEYEKADTTIKQKEPA